MAKENASVNDMVEYIPTDMFQFINEYKEYLAIDDDVQTRLGTHKALVVDINIKGSTSTFYFVKDKQKHITVRIDCISTIEEVIDFISGLNANEVRKAVAIGTVQGMWDKLHTKLKKLGYTMVYSHAMNWDCYGWHDLSFLPNEWNEQKFRQAQNLIFNFTLKIEKMIKGLKAKSA